MVLKMKFKFFLIALLMMFVVVPAFISVVSSSTGYIRVNSKTASFPNQQVESGGNVSLYFGDVSWAGSQLYLLMSYDTLPHASTGDVIYTPLISVSDLLDQSSTHAYSSGLGSWVDT